MIDVFCFHLSDLPDGRCLSMLPVKNICSRRRPLLRPKHSTFFSTVLCVSAELAGLVWLSQNDIAYFEVGKDVLTASLSHRLHYLAASICCSLFPATDKDTVTWNIVRLLYFLIEFRSSSRAGVHIFILNPGANSSFTDPTTVRIVVSCVINLIGCANDFESCLRATYHQTQRARLSSSS